MIVYFLSVWLLKTIIANSTEDDYTRLMRTDQYREGILDLPVHEVHPAVLSLIYTCTETRAAYRPCSFRTILDFLDKNT